MTQTGIEPATFRFVAQHLNHCATAVRYGYFVYMQGCKHPSIYKTVYTLQCKSYHNCVYSRLPEDEPSGLKHVEDIVKIKVLV